MSFFFKIDHKNNRAFIIGDDRYKGTLVKITEFLGNQYQNLLRKNF